jgi:hypothetical protein
MTKRLIIFSGADRVGKSTLIDKLYRAYQGEAMVKHHNAPSRYSSEPYEYYKKDLAEFVVARENVCIWDRGWPCSYILEQHREGTHDHLPEIVDLELYVMTFGIKVLHVAIEKSWSWSAPHHLEELKLENANSSDWWVRNKYINRMREHEKYYKELHYFLNNVTAFPHISHPQELCGSHEEVKTLYTQTLHF